MVYRTKLPETASVANSTGDERLFAPSADRNSTPIINLIKQIAPKSGEALEIASGTGQHIVNLALALPNLSWFPSEVVVERIICICAWIKADNLSNIKLVTHEKLRSSYTRCRKRSTNEVKLAKSATHVGGSNTTRPRY